MPATTFCCCCCLAWWAKWPIAFFSPGKKASPNLPPWGRSFWPSQPEAHILLLLVFHLRWPAAAATEEDLGRRLVGTIDFRTAKWADNRIFKRRRQSQTTAAGKLHRGRRRRRHHPPSHIPIRCCWSVGWPLAAGTLIICPRQPSSPSISLFSSQQSANQQFHFAFPNRARVPSTSFFDGRLDQE
jgi:hypothetical protein